MLSDGHASVLTVYYEECVRTNQKQDRRLTTAAPSALDYEGNQRDLRRWNIKQEPEWLLWVSFKTTQVL